MQECFQNVSSYLEDVFRIKLSLNRSVINVARGGGGSFPRGMENLPFRVIKSLENTSKENSIVGGCGPEIWLGQGLSRRWCHEHQRPLALDAGVADVSAVWRSWRISAVKQSDLSRMTVALPGWRHQFSRMTEPPPSQYRLKQFPVLFCNGWGLKRALL